MTKHKRDDLYFLGTVMYQKSPYQKYMEKYWDFVSDTIANDSFYADIVDEYNESMRYMKASTDEMIANAYFDKNFDLYVPETFVRYNVNGFRNDSGVYEVEEDRECISHTLLYTADQLNYLWLEYNK